MVVGVTSLAMVFVSFARPGVFHSFLSGKGDSGWNSVYGSSGSSNADVVAEANRGVVTVMATRAIRADETTPAIAESSEPRVQRGAGAGFIIAIEGPEVLPGVLIVTNQHVIVNADRIRVKLLDGRTQAAKVIGVDHATDLALLKIEANNLEPLPLGDSDAVRVGDPVIAIGNPLEYERSVTAGIISAKGRKVYENEPFEDFIQTDAAINRGNSGGPLLNRRGEVIGVNTVIRSDGRGISFAVPINVVKRVVAQLRAHGYVARGYLGLTPASLTPELRDGLKLGDVQGVLVADVSNNLPAARVGIEPYDVITHFNGREIRHTDDFFTHVSNTPPQQQVEITLLRGGRQMKFYPTLERRPEDAVASSPQVRPASEKRGQTGGQNSDLMLGFSVRENTPETLRELRISKLSDEITGGVIVSEIDPLGPAADSRLSPGYVILEANRRAIHSLEDFRQATSQLRKGDTLVIRFTPPYQASYQRAVRFAVIKVGES